MILGVSGTKTNMKDGAIFRNIPLVDKLGQQLHLNEQWDLNQNNKSLPFKRSSALGLG